MQSDERKLPLLPGIQTVLKYSKEKTFLYNKQDIL